MRNSTALRAALLAVLTITSLFVHGQASDTEMGEPQRGIQREVDDVENDPLGIARDAIRYYLKLDGQEVSAQQFDEMVQGLTVSQHPNLGEYYAVATTAGEFWVLAKRNQVIKYSAYPRFTPAEARNYAQEYILRHVPTFNDRNFVRTRAELDEPYWIEEYTEQAEPGQSIFENWITVVVNLDLRGIQDFNASELRLERSSPPQISESAAHEKIMAMYPTGQITELRLMEYTTDGGETSRTIWSATLLPDDDPESGLEFYSIDADTGEHVP